MTWRSRFVRAPTTDMNRTLIFRATHVLLRDMLFAMRLSVLLCVLGMILTMPFVPVCVQKFIGRWLMYMVDRTIPLMNFLQDDRNFGNIPLGVFGIFVSIFIFCFCFSTILKLTTSVIQWSIQSFNRVETNSENHD